MGIVDHKVQIKLILTQIWNWIECRRQIEWEEWIAKMLSFTLEIENRRFIHFEMFYKPITAISYLLFFPHTDNFFQKHIWDEMILDRNDTINYIILDYMRLSYVISYYLIVCYVIRCYTFLKTILLYANRLNFA